MQKYDDGQFSARLVELIHDRKITNKEVAVALGVSQQAITNWIQTGRIEYEHLRRLADYFQVNWVWFRYGAEALADCCPTPADDRERAARVRRLRAKAERLRLATEVAGIGTWDLDLLTGQVVWSDVAYRIFGTPPGTPITIEYFNALVHPDDLPIVSKAWQDHTEGLTPAYNVDHRIIRQDNHAIRLVREAGKLLDHDRLIGVVMDITED